MIRVVGFSSMHDLCGVSEVIVDNNVVIVDKVPYNGLKLQ